eukprot:6079991-Prymnesium_polylepis.1
MATAPRHARGYAADGRRIGPAWAWTVGGGRASVCRRGCQPQRSAPPPTAPCAAATRRLSHIAGRDR